MKLMKWHERPENAGKVGRLKKMYRNTKNDEIMLKLDISLGILYRTARALGLVKTKQFMRKCQRNAADKARESHIINGTFPRRKATSSPGARGIASRRARLRSRGSERGRSAGGWRSPPRAGGRR